MKVLVVTQVVDLEHSNLSFFHRWIELIAEQCTSVEVVALQVGSFDLPENVTVHSLEKEQGRSKLYYAGRFYRDIWQLRNQYDVVFVHMVPLYVVLGGWLWRMLGKRIGLWYTHGSVPASLVVANWFVHRIFTASPESCRLTSNKIQNTGHGIDLGQYNHPVSKIRDLIVVGRISPVKNIHVLLEITKDLKRIQPVRLTVVGAPLTITDVEYHESLLQQVIELGLNDVVEWVGPVTQKEVAKYIASSKVLVTASMTGSLDKAALEAMAAGVPIVSLAPGTQSLPLGEDQVDTQTVFIESVRKYLNGGVVYRTDYQEYIAKNHNLSRLVQTIVSELSR